MNLIKGHMSFSLYPSYLLFYTKSMQSFQKIDTEYTLYHCSLICLRSLSLFPPSNTQHLILLHLSIPPSFISLNPLFLPHISLFSVFKGSLRYLRPLWQALSEHADVVLWGPAHQPSDAQLSHWRRRPVHPAAPAVHQRGFAVTVGPLRLEPICLPLWYRQR